MTRSESDRRSVSVRGQMTRRGFLRRAGLAGLTVGMAPVLPAAGEGASMVGPMSINELRAGAKKEGMVLHAYGTPADWANYGEVYAGFQKRYGVSTIYKPEGDLTSAQELEKFGAEKNQPIADVGDVGFVWGAVAVQKGLVQAYKNSHWREIPNNLKHPNGFWVSIYSGAMSFAVNTVRVKHIPRAWKELLSPEYRNMISIDKDPRQAFDAFGAVLSASLANGGSAGNIEPGIEFFVKLKRIGNYIPVRAELASMQTGEAGIAIRWSFLNLGDRDAVKQKGGPLYEVVIPSDGSVATPDLALINRWAPHPYTARLFQEYLFSDEGQLAFLRGYATPTLINRLKIPSDLAAKLPPRSELAHVVYLTDLQAIKKSQQVINEQWGPKMVG